jgi:hypothetical protein
MYKCPRNMEEHATKLYKKSGFASQDSPMLNLRNSPAFTKLWHANTYQMVHEWLHLLKY